MNEDNQHEETSREESASGIIRDLGVLDLRFAKSPADLKHIKSIRDVGVVLVTEDAAAALSEISIRDVGSVVTLPSNVQVNCMTGQIKLSGEAIENGDPEAVLVLVGQTFITSPVRSVGFKEIRVIGQLMAPRDSQTAMSSKLTQLTGQVLYTPDNCRLVMGEETFNYEFLDLLPKPTSFMVLGQIKFARDVTKEIIQAKIPEIVLLGTIMAPRELTNILNVITPEKLGTIVASE